MRNKDILTFCGKLVYDWSIFEILTWICKEKMQVVNFSPQPWWMKKPFVYRLSTRTFKKAEVLSLQPFPHDKLSLHAPLSCNIYTKGKPK